MQIKKEKPQTEHDPKIKLDIISKFDYVMSA